MTSLYIPLRAVISKNSLKALRSGFWVIIGSSTGSAGRSDFDIVLHFLESIIYGDVNRAEAENCHKT